MSDEPLIVRPPMPGVNISSFRQYIEWHDPANWTRVELNGETPAMIQRCINGQIEEQEITWQES